MEQWTLNGTGDHEACAGFFPSLAAAKKAWENAGRPQERGSSVWASEDGEGIARKTATLAP